MGDPPKVITFNAKDDGISSTTNPRCVFSNYIQHRLNISRRAGNRPQDFTRRSLLLQRLFKFIEQSDIFDGNNRLVGKSFKQFDLRRGKGAQLDPTRSETSNKLSLQAKGNYQEGRPCARKRKWDIALRADIGDVKRAMIPKPAYP